MDPVWIALGTSLAACAATGWLGWFVSKSRPVELKRRVAELIVSHNETVQRVDDHDAAYARHRKQFEGILEDLEELDARIAKRRQRENARESTAKRAERQQPEPKEMSVAELEARARALGYTQ